MTSYYVDTQHLHEWAVSTLVSLQNENVVTFIGPANTCKKP